MTDEFKCELCDYSTKHRENLKRHMKTLKHINNEQEGFSLKHFIINFKYIDQGFCCDMCDFETKSLAKIKEHIYNPVHQLDYDDYRQERLQEFIDEVSSLNGFGPIDFQITENEFGGYTANCVF